MARRVVKPKPVVVTTICSICGEDWNQHQEVDGEVSTLECVLCQSLSRCRTIVGEIYGWMGWPLDRDARRGPPKKA